MINILQSDQNINSNRHLRNQSSIDEQCSKKNKFGNESILEEHRLLVDRAIDKLKGELREKEME
jgi:hypothetical protein